jgi:hypothetical protein
MVTEGKTQCSFALILSRYETILLTHSHILAGYLPAVLLWLLRRDLPSSRFGRDN